MRQNIIKSITASLPRFTSFCIKDAQTLPIFALKTAHEVGILNEKRCNSNIQNSSYNIITLGYDCSPAAALRDMGLRNKALPFDWVISNVESLEWCFHENFADYHKELYFNNNKTCLIDKYGFKFYHDYPTYTKTSNIPFIKDNWQEHYDKVLEKYQRRIQRFKDIMANPNPIIILCRYDVADVIKIKWLLYRYYNKTNVFFINSNQNQNPFRKSLLRHDYCNYIINCYTEENGIWNETAIWKLHLDQAIEKYN